MTHAAGTPVSPVGTGAAVTPPGRDGLPPAARRVAMLTVVLGITLSLLDSTAMNLALPGIVREMRTGEADAAWLINAYQLSTLALLLPLSMLGDLFGYRRVYIAGVAVFVLALSACALAQGPLTLAAGRVLVGAGAAGMFAVNAALVRTIYPHHLLGRGIAINSAVVAISTVAGPLVAAVVLSVARWPWLFAVNIPVALAVLGMACRSLPANASAHAETASIPWTDFALNAATFLLLFIGVQQLAQAGRHAGAIDSLGGAVALVAAGAAIGALYVRRQLREAVPLLPIDLLAIPVFRLSVATSVGSFAAQSLAFVAMPFLLLDGLGRTPAEAGWVLAAWPLGTVAVAPLAGRLIGRLPSGGLCAAGLLLMAAGLLALVWLPAHASALQIAWRLTLVGAGFALFQSPNNHTLMTSASAARSGGAAGMLATARLTGQCIGALIFGALYALWNGPSAQVPVVAVGVGAAFAAAGCLASLLRLRVQLSQSAPEPGPARER